MFSSIDPVNKTNLNKVRKLNKCQDKSNCRHDELKNSDSLKSDKMMHNLGRDLIYPIRVVRVNDIECSLAYQAETKPGNASFTLAKGDEVFPNIWDENGGYYTPKKGDIIMGYGIAQEDWGIKHPDVLAEMHEKGLTSYPDRAVSSEPDLMYETYEGKDGRDFQIEPLHYGETVDAVKKIFPTRFFFMPKGTFVETLEAREGAQEMPKLGSFQYIQLDAKGNPYVKDTKDLIKRLKPSNERSEKIFAKVKELNKTRENILNRTDINEAQKEELLSLIWKSELPKLRP